MYKLIIITLSLLIAGACNTTEQVHKSDKKHRVIQEQNQMKHVRQIRQHQIRSITR